MMMCNELRIGLHLPFHYPNIVKYSLFSTVLQCIDEKERNIILRNCWVDDDSRFRRTNTIDRDLKSVSHAIVFRCALRWCGIARTRRK